MKLVPLTEELVAKLESPFGQPDKIVAGYWDPYSREGWVDYLRPSAIQGRFHYFDVAPYQKAVRDTRCRLLPNLDALGWGLPIPGPFLWRVADLYARLTHGWDRSYPRFDRCG